jgi:hypothetical protein
MNAAKKRAAIWKRLMQWRRLVVSLIALTAAVLLGLALWPKLRPYIQEQPEYLVSAEAIEITPLPAWVHTDIVSEAIRDAGLPPQLSILDKKLADQLKGAFALHPWIAKVGSVRTSYPASIHVELTYRQPVALVEVDDGLLPIDAEGIVLPTADFSPGDTNNYPRIVGITSRPLKPVGTSWGDPAITAAALLAASLESLADILPRPTIRLADASLKAQSGLDMQPIFLLATASGTSFVWGAAPGHEPPGEASALDKLSMLRQLAAAHGSLDAIPADQRDLR